MNISIKLLLLSTLFLTACAQSKSGNSTSPVALGLCESYMSIPWINKTTGFTYDFKSDCSGQIKACDASFTYDIINDASVYVDVIKSNNNPGCPQQGTKGYCDYHIKDMAGIIQSMVMNCGAGEDTFVPLSGE